MAISTVNIKASLINREATFGEKRQFSFSQHWPNVIEEESKSELSMKRIGGKGASYNINVSGYKETFPFNSTPVIRVTDNGSNDGDLGVFPYMTENDWFSVDVAFLSENRSLISNEVFRVFFKNNSNDLNDIPFIKDPINTIAKGYTPSREWVALDNTVLVDFNKIGLTHTYTYDYPLTTYVKDNFIDLVADNTAYTQAVNFNYTGIDVTMWVATYVDGMTSSDIGSTVTNPARILRRYSLMDTTTNSYNWIKVGVGNPITNFQITSTSPNPTFTNYSITGISGDYYRIYQENEPLPRGGTLYGYKVGDTIYKREKSPNGNSYQWSIYQLQSINLSEGEPTTRSYQGIKYYGGSSKNYTQAKNKAITNTTLTYNAAIKQWVREYQDVSIYDGDKIVTSLPFADNYTVGTIVFLYYYNTDNNKWQYDKYKLISSSSPYEPNDRYEDFENYGNFQSNYYGPTSRKFGWFDSKYGVNRGCQVYEWKGNNGFSNKNKWMLTSDYNPALRVGNPSAYDGAALPSPNGLAVGTTILYRPFGATNYDYYTVAPDTSNVKNFICRVFYHPGNKEVWASAQYNGGDTISTKCQVIIRKITYWPYGTSTKDQIYPNYLTYTGQKIATTADGIDQKILDLFEEIYFRPPDLETAKALQTSVNSGQYTIDQIRIQMSSVIATNQPWNSRIFNSNQKLRVKMATRWEDYNSRFILANGTEIQTHINGYDDVKWSNKTIGDGTHNGIPPNIRSTVSNLEWNFYVNT
jgi:hypothetical protein